MAEEIGNGGSCLKSVWQRHQYLNGGRKFRVEEAFYEEAIYVR